MIRLTTFGGLAIAHSERALGGATAQPRRLALLAVLARSGGRGLSRDRLLSLFWPDEDVEKARKSLAQSIYALRRDLGDEQVISGTQELRLDPDLIGSDVAEFGAHVKGGRLIEAAALYTGPFLQGFHLVGAPSFERWAEDERSAVQGEVARVLERLALAAERNGAAADAAVHWKALAALDPLDARVTVKLMMALDAIGDRAAALKQARIYEALTAQELELPPDREVVALADKLRKSAPVAAPITAPVVSPVVAPVVAPVLAPLVAPLVAPVESTLEIPVAVPVEAPVDVPVEAPVEVPVSAIPVVASPVIAPTISAPTSPPLSAPHSAAQSTPKRAWTPWAMAAVAGIAVVWSIAARSQRNSGGANDVQRTRHITIDAGLELDPAVSPDGKLVAYISADSGRSRVFVRQLEGSRPIAVSAGVPGDHRRPRWSPDASRLLFQDESSIWSVPALGGTPIRVVGGDGDSERDARYPTWSPDGKDIAWVSRDRVFRRAVSGGTARMIGGAPAIHSLTWSPDGKWIAAAVGNGSFIYGTFLRPRSGETAIGNVAPSSIVVVPADSGAVQTVMPATGLSTSPEWLGDSEHLVYVSDQFGTRDLFVIELNGNGAARGVPARLTVGLDAHSVSASRDGKTVVYSTFRQESNIFSADATSGLGAAVAVTRGEQSVEGMSLSPDGTQIVFDTDRSGPQELYAVSVDGGEPRRLTSGSNDFQPAWSPDGRRIAFYRVVDGRRSLFTVSADGGEATTMGISKAVDQRTASWMPDSKRIVFFEWANLLPQIMEADASKGGAARALTTRGGQQPQVSPDGKWIAYMTASDTVKVMAATQSESSSRAVFVGTSTGPTPLSFRWSSADMLVVKAYDNEGRIGFWIVLPTCLQGISSCAAPALLAGPDRERRLSARPEFAVMGKRLYFGQTDRHGDLWSIALNR